MKGNQSQRRNEIATQLTLACPQPPGIETLNEWCSLAGHWRVREHHLARRVTADMVLLYCVYGSGWLMLDGVRHPVGPGDLLYCPAMVEHGYGCDRPQGWEILWVHFRGTHAATLCELTGLSHESPVLRLGMRPAVQASFADLLRVLAAGAGNGVAWDAAGRLHLLLLVLIRCCHGSGSEGSLVERVRDDCQSLDEMARQAGYSKYHFARLFKEQTGRSPWQYLTEHRLDRARELLLASSRSIKEVAADVGFENPDYFARLFARRHGVTPRQYRGSR